MAKALLRLEQYGLHEDIAPDIRERAEANMRICHTFLSALYDQRAIHELISRRSLVSLLNAIRMYQT
jgi:hypothetical protein